MRNYGNLFEIPKEKTSKLVESIAELRRENTPKNTFNEINFIDSSNFSSCKNEKFNDFDIIQSIKNGDFEPFNLFDNKYRKELLSFTKTVIKNFHHRDSNEASKDIIQETFTYFILLVNSGKVRDDVSILSYMKGALYRNCKNYIRENSHKKLPNFIDEFNEKKCDNYEGNEDSINPLFSTVLEESGDKISEIANMLTPSAFNKALTEMKPIYKNVFEMFYYEGLSHKEIGNKLNMTQSQSISRLNNARKNMKKLIEKELF